jgi:hypothetical protein
MGSLDIAKDHLQRGSQHEDEDYECAVQNLLGRNFDDWPNEAGVSINTVLFNATS